MKTFQLKEELADTHLIEQAQNYANAGRLLMAQRTVARIIDPIIRSQMREKIQGLTADTLGEDGTVAP